MGDVTGNCISVPVRMTAGRELVTDDVVMFLNGCRETNAEQKIALQRLLNERHLAWGKRRGVCSESSYAPKDRQPVKPSIPDEHVILGGKEIDEKGHVCCIACWNRRPRQIFRYPTSERACVERTAEVTRTAGNACQTQ